MIAPIYNINILVLNKILKREYLKPQLSPSDNYTFSCGLLASPVLSRQLIFLVGVVVEKGGIFFWLSSSHVMTCKYRSVLEYYEPNLCGPSGGMERTD